MNGELVPLGHVGRVRVRQVKEMLEVFTGWETRNRYAIVDDHNRTLLVAGETGGVGSFFLRHIFGSKRPFTIEVRGPDGRVALSVERPFTFFFSRADILDGNGQRIGRIQQRFKLFGRRYDIEDAQGNVVATIQGPFFSPWTFNVHDPGGAEVGLIKKRFGGGLAEIFTDADNFAVSFGPGLTPAARVLLLGATFLIDFVHFESTTQ